MPKKLPVKANDDLAESGENGEDSNEGNS